MVEYSLELIISNSNATANSFKYRVNLTPQEEDCPEQKFNSQFCQEVRRDLQQQSSCRINQANLNRIIGLWIKEIKEGYRETSITMDLPTLIGEDIESVSDTGNQQLPQLIAPSLSSIEPKIGELPKLNFS